MAVHVLVVLLVLAGGDVVHPRLVVEIPADSFVDTLLELETRAPAQLAVQLRGVDGIPQVVARTVRDVGDEINPHLFLKNFDEIEKILSFVYMPYSYSVISQLAIALGVVTL